MREQRGGREGCSNPRRLGSFTLVDGDDPGPSRPLESPHAPARGVHGLASSALDHC